MGVEKMKTEDARAMLLNMAKGGQQYYEINAYVDAKGIITVLGCRPLRDDEGVREGQHFIVQYGGDNDIYYYEGDDGRTYGRELCQMARAAAERLTPEDYYKAAMQFCKERPQDVGRTMLAMISAVANNEPRYWDDDIDKGLRTDYEEVLKELRRRNCRYMKEFFNVDVPENLNCEADMKAKQRIRQ